MKLNLLFKFCFIPRRKNTHKQIFWNKFKIWNEDAYCLRKPYCQSLNFGNLYLGFMINTIFKMSRNSVARIFNGRIFQNLIRYLPKYFKEDTTNTPQVHLIRVVAISQEALWSPVPVESIILSRDIFIMIIDL